jgi:phospholipase C
MREKNFMAYPLKTFVTVQPGKTVTVPFRPAAAGLVKVIVSATGVLPPPVKNTGGEADPTPLRLGIILELFAPGNPKAVFSTPASQDLNVKGAKDNVLVWNDAPASASELSADWTVNIKNTGTVPAGCNVTVRYQVVAGNLGKVDHIVVMMLENRSFDHMLGYLSLPQAMGGLERSDVDGLKGNEFNNDAQGHAVRVHRLASTRFASDPGHGWNDVAQQLSGGNPAFTSNAGFVTNFANQLANDAKGLPPQMQTVHDSSKVAVGGSRLVHFRPLRPGAVVARASTPGGASHSESGSLAKLTLQRPGNARLATNTAPISQTFVSVSYQATAADLAVAGDWTCQLENMADNELTFSTDVSFTVADHDTRSQEPVASIMGYHTADQVPTYNFLAANFAICDRWFASLPTDTWPNRLYGMTGGSGNDVDTPSTTLVETNPPGFNLKSIFEVLQEQGVDWSYYFSDFPFGLVFQRLIRDAAFTSRMRSIDDFVTRAATGDLPAVSWLDPNFNDVPDGPQFSNDDHPPGDVLPGQQLVHRIYTALAASPAWSKTLFLITYDEHGGFYDHVFPPGTPAVPLPEPPQQPAAGGPEDADANLQRYGLRVPAFVISAWAPPAFVAKKTYDHTSLLSTILRRFCLGANGQPVSMGLRTDTSLDVGGILSAETPRESLPTAPLVPAAAAVAAGPTNPNAFGAVLRKAVVGF